MRLFPSTHLPKQQSGAAKTQACPAASLQHSAGNISQPRNSALSVHGNPREASAAEYQSLAHVCAQNAHKQLVACLKEGHVQACLPALRASAWPKHQT
jgi:hypothetical protein